MYRITTPIFISRGLRCRSNFCNYLHQRYSPGKYFLVLQYHTAADARQSRVTETNETFSIFLSRLFHFLASDSDNESESRDWRGLSRRLYTIFATYVNILNQPSQNKSTVNVERNPPTNENTTNFEPESEKRKHNVIDF